MQSLLNIGLYLLIQSSGRNAQYVYMFYKMEYVSRLELNPKLSKVFCKHSLILARCSLLVMNFLTWTYYITLTIVLSIFYINYQDKLSFILMFTQWLMYLIGGRTTIALIVTTFYFAYIISIYLKLRFRQTYKNCPGNF